MATSLKLPSGESQKPDSKRWYAILILIVFMVIIYFLFFQSFVSDHALLSEEMADLEQNRQDFTELASQTAELQTRINQVKETVGDNSNFLLADSYNLGTAELTRILKGIVAKNTGSRKECDTISNTPSRDRDPDQFEKIIIKVRMRCEFDKMVSVLRDIEQFVPLLFLDDLQLEQRTIRRSSRRNATPVKPMLEVKFDLYAYMNNPIRAKDDDKK